MRVQSRLLGGGFTRGSMILLAGSPGIGKSTILLHLAGQLCEAGAHAAPVVFVSGEESLAQVKARASRLGITSSALLLLNETNLDAVLATLAASKPLGGYLAVVVDSIQTMYAPASTGSPGSVSQVRACQF